VTASSALFIADVHLRADEAHAPELQRFLRFLHSLPGTTRRLFILGDLFDLWTGHADASVGPFAAVLDALQELHRAGLTVTFVAGNRDFLLYDYLQRTRRFDSVLDSCVIELDHKTLHLSHGDILCSRDRRHLRLRRILVSPLFRRLFLACPVPLARYLAARLRRWSERSVRSKTAHTLAVDEQALHKVCSAGIDVVVCGHTHRPEHRVFDEDARTCELFVLEPWVRRPGFLVYRDGQFMQQNLHDSSEGEL